MINITLSHNIRLNRAELPEALYRQLLGNLTFVNPRYQRDLRFDPNTATPPEFRAYYESDTDTLLINRGYMGKLIRLFQAHRLDFRTHDQTVIAEHPFVYSGNLTGAQETTLRDVCRRRYLNLCASLGAGKKQVALAWIARRQQRTLIVVKTKVQLYEWAELAKAALHMGDDDLGLVGDRHQDLDRPLVIGIDRSLYRCLLAHSGAFGACIVDRADSVNLKVFSNILCMLPVAFSLCLSTAHGRPDKLTPFFDTFTGPAVSGTLRGGLPQGRGGQIKPRIWIKPTKFEYPYADDYGEMITALCADADRNGQIAADILADTADPKRRCLVLSERVEHLKSILGKMVARECGLLHGKTPEAEADKLFRRFQLGNLQVLFCTFKSIDRLNMNRKADVLVVACPGKYSEYLAQAINRHLGSRNGLPPVIYDYKDNIKVLQGSLSNRVKYYTRFGGRGLCLSN